MSPERGGDARTPNPLGGESELRGSAAAAAAAGGAAAVSSGLVYLGTRDTCIPLDGAAKRLTRMRRGVITAARLAQEEFQEGGFRYRAAFVTVTYRPGDSWDAGDIRKLVKHYRQWGQRRKVNLPIVWTAEVHTAGGPNHGQIHYHLVIFVPRGLTPPMPDKQGWWRKGLSNCKWAFRPVGYLAKYASKGAQGPPMPKGAHLWGISGLSASVRTLMTYHMAPKWLRDFTQPGELLKKIANGWWRNCTTWWEYKSPWRFEWTSDGRPQVELQKWTEWDFEYVPPDDQILAAASTH